MADAVLWLHIATGAAALFLGIFNLLCTQKGSRLHVQTGRMFWYSMIAMAVTGILVAIERPKARFVLIGILSMYLVNTGRNALRGSATGARRIVDHLWRMIAALLFAMFALFIANPSVFPTWFTGAALNFVPPLLVLATIAYWVLAVKRGWWRRA